MSTKQITTTQKNISFDIHYIESPQIMGSNPSPMGPAATMFPIWLQSSSYPNYLLIEQIIGQNAEIDAPKTILQKIRAYFVKPSPFKPTDVRIAAMEVQRQIFILQLLVPGTNSIANRLKVIDPQNKEVYITANCLSLDFCRTEQEDIHPPTLQIDPTYISIIRQSELAASFGKYFLFSFLFYSSFLRFSGVYRIKQGMANTAVTNPKNRNVCDLMIQTIKGPINPPAPNIPNTITNTV